eukprot:6773759-Prymnesium_polylepis.1
MGGPLTCLLSSASLSVGSWSADPIGIKPDPSPLSHGREVLPPSAHRIAAPTTAVLCLVGGYGAHRWRDDTGRASSDRMRARRAAATARR